MMDKVNDILDRLRHGTQFSLARFNDGEIMGILKAGCTVARGDQFVSPELSSLLYAALLHEGREYWKGLPCSLCWPKLRKFANDLVGDDYPYLTKAVVCANRNWNIFVEGFSQAVVANGRKVVWVSGNDQDTSKLPFPVASRIRLPARDAFSAFDDIVEGCRDFEPNSVVVLSCGPLSRVLAHQWWRMRQDCTFIDVGSAFDPFTRGVRHRCHIWKDGRNALPPCKECN